MEGDFSSQTVLDDFLFEGLNITNSAPQNRLYLAACRISGRKILEDPSIITTNTWEAIGKLSGMPTLVKPEKRIFAEIELFGCCIISCIATFIYEGTKSLMLHVQVQIQQNPLTNKGKVNSIQDRSPLFSSLVIPSSVDHVKRRRLRYHVFGYFVHIFNVTLGYFIMLAVMQFSTWVTISVLIGSCIGYFIFGALNSWNKWKFSHLMRTSADNSPTTSQRDLLNQ